MNRKPYREDISIDTILEDGWSRGFDPAQTVREAAEMGYTITEEQVLSEWSKLDAQFHADMSR